MQQCSLFYQQIKRLCEIYYILLGNLMEIFLPFVLRERRTRIVSKSVYLFFYAGSSTLFQEINIPEN